MSESVVVEFVMLANHVEVVNGLLYVSGGGWTDHRRPIPASASAPLLSHLGIAASVLVPWNETNHEHVLTVQIEDEDANVILKIEGHLNVGRPPNLPPGASQPVMFGFPVDLHFPRPGGYRVTAYIESGTPKYWPFRVHDMPGVTGVY